MKMTVTHQELSGPHEKLDHRHRDPAATSVHSSRTSVIRNNCSGGSEPSDVQHKVCSRTSPTSSAECAVIGGQAGWRRSYAGLHPSIQQLKRVRGSNQQLRRKPTGGLLLVEAATLATRLLCSIDLDTKRSILRSISPLFQVKIWCLVSLLPLKAAASVFF